MYTVFNIECLYKAHVQAIGVRRPGFGVSGRQITVGANAAELTMPNETIYHYDGKEKLIVVSYASYSSLQSVSCLV
jgi:hypothetical protein